MGRSKTFLKIIYSPFLDFIFELSTLCFCFVEHNCACAYIFLLFSWESMPRALLAPTFREFQVEIFPAALVLEEKPRALLIGTLLCDYLMSRVQQGFLCFNELVS